MGSSEAPVDSTEQDGTSLSFGLVSSGLEVCSDSDKDTPTTVNKMRYSLRMGL